MTQCLVILYSPYPRLSFHSVSSLHPICSGVKISYIAARLPKYHTLRPFILRKNSTIISVEVGRVLLGIVTLFNLLNSVVRLDATSNILTPEVKDELYSLLVAIPIVHILVVVALVECLCKQGLQICRPCLGNLVKYDYLKYMSRSSLAAMNEESLASKTLCSMSAMRDSISGLL